MKRRKMATVNVITNPGTYSPINAEVWFNLNSASSSVSDFKYVVDVNRLILYQVLELV